VTDPRQSTPEFNGVGFWPTGESIGGRPVWCVVGGPLIYLSKRLGRIVIPEGFTFDGPSIPWVASWAMPAGAMFLGSAVHDYLLAETAYDKHLCDKVFLDALRHCRCPEWAATLAYRAVRTQPGRD
jgi:hypothetical protein